MREIMSYTDPHGILWNYIILPSGCIYWNDTTTHFLIAPFTSFSLGHNHLEVRYGR